ncbi:MAG: hypothetical protein AAF602_02895, partial [Myxococcota bacterium]
AGRAATQALRVPCQWVAVYARLAPLADTEAAAWLDTRAREGADWLVAVQHDSGVFPFPDLTDDAAAFREACRASGAGDCEARLPRAYELAELGRARWEAAGRPSGHLRDGWWFEDAITDPGGLQFDNGICGRALLDAHARLGDPRYLEAARRAGDWATSRPVVGNFNYNAFSVGLLARLAEVDTATDWADRALHKARLGVLPGALADGRWFDPHNARINYHQILLGNLAMLAAVVDDPWVDATLHAAARRSITEIRQRGATAFDDGIEAHIGLRELARDDSDTLERLVDGATDGVTPRAAGVAWWLAFAAHD